jgi:predicted MFS family arabinose efflux permease
MRVSNGSLDQAGAYNAVLWIGVPAYLVSALLMFKARSAPPVIEQAYGTVEKIRPPWGLLFFLGILFAMQLMSENFMFLFYNVYLGEDLSISTNQIGTIFAVGRLIPFFISPLLPLMLNRSGAGRVMTAGYFLMAIVFLLMARIPIWQVAAAGFILISLLSNFSVISRNIFSQEIVKPRWRTTVNAVISICLALSMGVAGMVGGRIIPIIGFSGMFTIGAALALLSVLLYAIWQLKSSRRLLAKTPIEV